MADDADLYRRLQQHLDAQPVGFPAAASGADLRLLQRLFSPDEARLVLYLSYEPATLAEVAARAAAEIPAEEVERLLRSMALEGSIGWKEKDGAERWYTMPLVVGMYETVQAGTPEPEFQADARAYFAARVFGRSFLGAKPSQMRIVPIQESIEVAHHVAPYDRIRDLVASAAGPFVVLHCICREVRWARGERCSRTARAETCLAFDDLAAALLRRGKGREVGREEVLAILAQNEADGLVLQPSNTRRPEAVCSCCGCCCGLLAMQKAVPRPVDFWSSNHQCSVDPALCTACGECVERCQVGALGRTGPDDVASVNLDRCIGCGLCVPACPGRALALVQKASPATPPEDAEALYAEILANRRARAARER